MVLSRTLCWGGILAVAAVAAVAGLTADLCMAGPVVTVGAEVPPDRRVPVDAIDHSQWDALLRRHVDAKGYVNYTMWKASTPDRQALDRYLAHLSEASLSQQSSRESRLAYWINAYNAVTVKGILREYPTTSIRNHTAKVFGYNIWKDLRLLVDGQAYSLDQIEHEILRKLGEPRIHFAIVCASVGCPRLLREAYVAEHLEAQLFVNSKAFFADPSKFQYDVGRRTVSVSPILKWFAEDFGASPADQLRRIAPLLPDTESRQLAESGAARIRYLDYDWGLNDRSSGDRASAR